jgi:predicted aspartyl protease
MGECVTMATQLTFSERVDYCHSQEGVTLYVKLISGGQETQVEAKVDTGAAVCLFSLEVAEELGIDVESGFSFALGGFGGSLEAFGHEVVLQTGDIAFESVVYFVNFPGLPRNLLGRQGWLRNLRLAVVDYDQVLYLNAYESPQLS